MVMLVAACGTGDDSPGVPDAGGPLPPDAADPGCPRAPADGDRPRLVVVSHPYGASGEPAVTWAALTLAADGTLAPTGETFSMGRATGGVVAFTPDGEVGLVAQGDGTLGVFRVTGGGIEVVHPAFAGSFYASSVVVAPSGDRAWVLDGNWRENGGGIYQVAIGCDGTLTEEGRVAEAKLPYALVPVEGGRYALASRDVLVSTPGDDVHLLSLDGEPELFGGADAFGDDEAIVASAAAAGGGRYLLLGDNSEFSGVGNRVAVVKVTATGLEPVQVLPSILDPFSIAASPFGGVAVVASGYGDALLVLEETGDDAAPFAVRGELSYDGPAPQLPGDTAVVTRGAHRGLALVVENQGLRRLRFTPEGDVQDLGIFSLGEGLAAIPGALGVQP